MSRLLTTPTMVSNTRTIVGAVSSLHGTDSIRPKLQLITFYSLLTVFSPSAGYDTIVQIY